jgi:molecular chaperone GrpE
LCRWSIAEITRKEPQKKKAAMSADTKPEDQKPNDPQNAQQAPAPGQGASDHAARQEVPAAGDATDNGQPSGRKAYVDPSIAAEAQIADLESKVAEGHDRYMRAMAELDNLRKRTEREKADISKYAVTNFARDMVAIADNLRRAIEAAAQSAPAEEQSGPLKALLDGVALTDQELQKALEKHGVRSIPSAGQIFDPHKHQAVMEQDDPSVPAGTVLQVFQEGYQIEERVLRPSMVVVAKGGAKPVKSSDAAPNIGGDAAKSGASEQGRSGEDPSAPGDGQAGGGAPGSSGNA